MYRAPNDDQASSFKTDGVPFKRALRQAGQSGVVSRILGNDGGDEVVGVKSLRQERGGGCVALMPRNASTLRAAGGSIHCRNAARAIDDCERFDKARGNSIKPG